MKLITEENIPCWYELSWREKEPAILLRVHKDLLRDTRVIFSQAPIIKGLKEEFGFTDFIGNFNEDFGFDGAFNRHKETEEFVEFLIKIPIVKKETDKNCPYCKGSGQDTLLDFERECLYCEGTGKEHLYDWKPAYTISASFTVFSCLSRHPKKETSATFPQLLTITTITTRELHGGSLSGEFSVPLCNWMDSLRENTAPNRATIPEMIKAMKVAYSRMLGLTEFEEHYFRASVDYEGGWLNTSCPGNACGLNPVHMRPKKGKGYEFSCHNVDTPVQQITLLASLAALHDRARKELKF